MPKKATKRGPGRPTVGEEVMSVGLTTRYSAQEMRDIEDEIRHELVPPKKGMMVRILVAEAIATRKAKRGKR